MVSYWSHRRGAASGDGLSVGVAGRFDVDGRDVFDESGVGAGRCGDTFGLAASAI